jgi:hypothetical protein
VFRERVEKHPPASGFVRLTMSSVNTGYPQVDRFIHRKQRVIHRHGVWEVAVEFVIPPYLGDTRTQGPGVGGVDIGSGVVETAGTDHLPLL